MVPSCHDKRRHHNRSNDQSRCRSYLCIQMDTQLDFYLGYFEPAPFLPPFFEGLQRSRSTRDLSCAKDVHSGHSAHSHPPFCQATKIITICFLFVPFITEWPYLSALSSPPFHSFILGYAKVSAKNFAPLLSGLSLVR